MHELGLCESILEAVERRADGRRVERVRIRVGTLLRVVEPALEQSFEMVAQGSVADGAAIEMVVIPVTLRCRACGHEARSEDVIALCPSCGSADVDVAGGDELLLESIELAETRA